MWVTGFPTLQPTIRDPEASTLRLLVPTRWQNVHIKVIRINKANTSVLSSVIAAYTPLLFRNPNRHFIRAMGSTLVWLGARSSTKSRSCGPSRGFIVVAEAIDPWGNIRGRSILNGLDSDSNRVPTAMYRCVANEWRVSFNWTSSHISKRSPSRLFKKLLARTWVVAVAIALSIWVITISKQMGNNNFETKNISLRTPARAPARH